MRRLPLLLVVFVLAACKTAAPPLAPAPPTPAAPALPTALHWVRSSAEHRAALLQTYRLATERLEEVVAELPAGTAWAVGLDGDETVIDNSLYQKERAALGQGYSAESWKAWVERKAAPALPGAAAFLTRVHGLGGKIAIVTNRSAAECPPTEENFRAKAIPFDVMLCMAEGGSSEKEPRWEQIEKGTAAPDLPPLRIVMFVGDNIKDFPDLDQTLRTQPDAAFAEFGKRYFLIPNPMYGSWERNPVE
jgi:5'-nucleotidase (lipoprotein e(P4) family)